MIYFSFKEKHLPLMGCALVAEYFALCKNICRVIVFYADSGVLVESNHCSIFFSVNVPTPNVMQRRTSTSLVQVTRVAAEHHHHRHHAVAAVVLALPPAHDHDHDVDHDHGPPAQVEVAQRIVVTAPPVGACHLSLVDLLLPVLSVHSHGGRPRERSAGQIRGGHVHRHVRHLGRKGPIDAAKDTVQRKPSLVSLPVHRGKFV